MLYVIKDVSMVLSAGIGLLIGIPLGVVIHRGDFCMHGAFQKLV